MAAALQYLREEGADLAAADNQNIQTIHLIPRKQSKGLAGAPCAGQPYYSVLQGK